MRIPIAVQHWKCMRGQHYSNTLWRLHGLDAWSIFQVNMGTKLNSLHSSNIGNVALYQYLQLMLAQYWVLNAGWALYTNTRFSSKIWYSQHWWIMLSQYRNLCIKTAFGMNVGTTFWMYVGTKFWMYVGTTLKVYIP